jgi:hypothetical protein
MVKKDMVRCGNQESHGPKLVKHSILNKHNKTGYGSTWL